ncbi:hypothetical protein JHD50_09490 [Sulfurimonas sp. MAG313]|nr:hypothetical protein [Sulfurimonas sp. MAG313]MDF1881530.1 hypothetical protein [Sulfurimonas sp. MAG313]
MHTILAKWLFPAIFVGVAFFLILFLVQVNQNDASIYADKADIPQAKDLLPIPSKEKWIERFSEHEDEGYFYPVSEIYVEVDLKDPPKKTMIYQLKAGDLDSYQLFCLKEVLKQYKVKYLFEQKKEDMKLIIYSEDISQLKNIVKTLKNYAINARIKKIIR